MGGDRAGPSPSVDAIRCEMRSIRTNITRARFLEKLSECAVVSHACAEAGISPVALYAWRRDDADFRAAWEEALALGLLAIEDKATEFAMAGSEKLMMFILAARKPEVYGQRQSIELNSTVQVSVRNASVDDLKAELARLLAPPALTIDNVVPFAALDAPED